MVPAALATLFKKADRLSAFYEATQLAGFEEAEARRLFGAPPKALKTPRLTPLATAEAQAQFLERFHRLAMPSAIAAKKRPCPAFWSPPCPAWTTPSTAIAPSHLVSLLSPEHMIETPGGLSRRPPSSWASTTLPIPAPATAPPGRDHIDRLLAFSPRAGTRSAPLLIHCWAGISRSMASAFTVLCDRLGPDREVEIALRHAPARAPRPAQSRFWCAMPTRRWAAAAA